MIKHSESTHWYKKDGTPCYEIEYADKKRKGEFRPTTLGDAKKLDLVPSVTVICNQLAKPQLEVWKQNQILMSAFTCPESRDDVEAEVWMGRVQADAQEQAKVAKEKGVTIHGEVEKLIKGEKVADAHVARCLTVFYILERYGILIGNIETEKSFATGKYGGKIDILSRPKKFIADVKTTEFTLVDGVPWKNGKKAKLYYPEHVLQLTGYIMPNFLEVPTMVNIYVSTIDDSVYIHEWSIDEYYNAMRQFELLVDLWWLRNMPDKEKT